MTKHVAVVELPWSEWQQCRKDLIAVARDLEAVEARE